MLQSSSHRDQGKEEMNRLILEGNRLEVELALHVACVGFGT